MSLNEAIIFNSFLWKESDNFINEMVILQYTKCFGAIGLQKHA